MYPSPCHYCADSFVVLQVWYPLLRFREEGMTTFTVGPEEGRVYTSKKGYPAKADRSIDSVTTQVHMSIITTISLFLSPIMMCFAIIFIFVLF